MLPQVAYAQILQRGVGICERKGLHLSYEQHLWMEKELKTVANVTASDIEQFLEVAALIPIKPEVQTFALADANAALQDLRAGHLRGANVLII